MRTEEAKGGKCDNFKMHRDIGLAVKALRRKVYTLLYQIV